MSLGSGAFEGAYSFQSRFEEGENGTNPEELIAAAHAGCFSMALSLVLGEGGNAPESIETEAKVALRQTRRGPDDHEVGLTTRGRVPGIDEADFKKAAEAAKRAASISRALGGVAGDQPRRDRWRAEVPAARAERRERRVLARAVGRRSA